MADIKTYNIRNIENAQFVYQPLDYQALEKDIAKQKKLVQLLQQTGEIEQALEAAAELNELEQKKEQFKENVFRLYETFTKIEINTERLAQAKAHFDQGEFREADAILNAADMTRDLNQLLERDQQLDREKAENAQHRTQLANEFLIKARLWATFYEQPNRFEQSCNYFEDALRATRTPETVFEYALFLQNHHCFDPAKRLYEEALQTYRTLATENPRFYSRRVAFTLSNLAILQSDQHDYDTAQGNYEEAWQIYQGLPIDDQHTLLPDVANIINNLAVLQLEQHNYAEAQNNSEKALQIYRSFATKDRRTYLPAVAHTLNNLANSQHAQYDYSTAQGNYRKALRIYRCLATKDRRTNLPAVAKALSNLANLQADQRDYATAQNNYEESLDIQQRLATKIHTPIYLMW